MHDCEASRDHEVAASEDRAVPGGLEYVHAYQDEVTECTALGDSDWAGDHETHADQQRRCWRSWQTTALRASHAPTVIAHISNGTELYALQRAAAGALQTQHITTGWRRPVRATVRSDDTAAIGISSRSGAGKLKHLGVKEFRIQELVQARKLVIKKVGGDNLADVGTKYNEDGKKLVHLSSLSVLRMKKGLEMKALSGNGGLARLCEHRARWEAQ